MPQHNFRPIGTTGAGHTAALLPPAGWQTPALVDDSLGGPPPTTGEDPESSRRSLDLLERIAAETKHLKALRDATSRHDAHGRNR